MIRSASRAVAACLLTFVATGKGRGDVISEFTTGPQLLGELIVGPDGNLYFGGGRVTLDGVVTPLVGSQDCGLSPLGFPAQGFWMEDLAFAGDGSLWFTMPCGSNQFPPYPPLVRSVLGRSAPDGVRTTTIDGSIELIGLPDGTVWTR